VIPTDAQLEARRRRIVELWGLPDRYVATQLIAEGFFTQPPDGRLASDPIEFAESCRRTVNNDRRAIREQWRTPRTSTVQDRNESLEEYVARLQTCVDQMLERMMTRNVKDTPYAQMMDSVLRYQTAIAKARGTDAAPPSEGDDPSGTESKPYLGLILGIDNLSPAARAKIAKWVKKKPAKDDDESS